MTNKELSQAIRKELKENGYTSKDVSVKVRDCGYSTSADITIKNAMVSKSAVEAIVNHFEAIDRDARTYVTLEGCNVYIFVKYEYGLLEAAAESLIPTAEMVLSNKEKYSGHKIAESSEKTVHITHYSGNEWILSEFSKAATEYEYKPTKWIKSAADLAIAMWKFRNIGTIYA